VNNIPTYVLNHLPNQDRKIFCEEQFGKQKIEFQFINGFTPEEVKTPEDDTITDKEYSLYCKHEEALKKGLETESEFILIFEDDILICPDFMTYYNMFINQFRELEGDLLMIGTAFNEIPTKLEKGKYVYYEPHFRTRCTHAILYSRKGAQTVLDNLNIGVYRGYDHKLNNIINDLNLKTCWLEPGLHQGSIGGTQFHRFPTTIR
jgi:GR25 family glycosyltransferase involved in LPS biosynthesis